MLVSVSTADSWRRRARNRQREPDDASGKVYDSSALDSRYAASRAPSRECRRDVSGVAAALATTLGCPTISVAVRARVIAV